MQPLPSAVQTERAYLGNILTFGNEAIFNILDPCDFYKPAHGEIYETILKLDKKGDRADGVSVGALCKKHFGLVSEMIDHATSGAMNKPYARTIKDLSRRRAAILDATEFINKATTTEDFKRLAETFIEKISVMEIEHTSFEQGADQDGILVADDMSFVYADHVESLRQGGLKTGIGDIDSEIRCIAKGEVMTVLARPGCFKTALLQKILLNFVETNKDEVAVFFSLEMPVAGVFERFSQNILGLSGSEIESRWMNDTLGIDNIRKIMSRLDRICVIPTKVTIGQMGRYCRMIEKKLGKKIGVVGIDYLGLVEDAGKSEYERNSKVAVDVKLFAKALKVPVVLLAQLNRTGGDGTIPVTLDMARGSGQIEEAADFVIGLWKMGEMTFGRVPLGCGILKNRKGRAGRILPLVVDPIAMQFGVA